MFKGKQNSYKGLIILIGIISFCLGFQPETSLNTTSTNFTNDTIAANSFIRISEQLNNDSNFDGAIEELEKAKRIFEKYELWDLVVKQTVEQAIIADWIGVETKKKYAEASLKLAEKYLNKEHMQLGTALEQMAEVCLMEGDYDQSIKYYEKCLKIYKKQENWTFYAWALISKSVNYIYKEAYSLSKEDLRQADEIYKKHEIDEEVKITILDLRSIIYKEEGNFEDAKENRLNSIAFYLSKENLTYMDSSFISISYSNLANICMEQESFYETIDYLNKGITYTEGNEKNNVNTLNSISDVHYVMEKYEQSIKFAYRQINVANKLPQREKNEALQEAYSVLGNNYLALEKKDSSTYFYQKSLELPTKKYYNRILIEYAKLLVEQNKADEAIEFLQRIKPNGLKKYVKASYYRNYGLALGLKKDFKKSTFYFQKALHINLPSFTDTMDYYKNPTTLVGVSNPSFFLNDLKFKAQNLSQFPEKQENLEAALATYEVAFQFIDTLFQSYAYDENRIINNKRSREIYEQAIGVTNELYQRTKDKKYISKAFRFAEKIKSNVLMTTLQGSDSQHIIPEKLQTSEQTLAAKVAFYERQLQLAKNNKEAEKIQLYQSNLTDYRLQLSTVKDTIKRDFSKYYNLKYTTQLATIPTIQTDLKENQSFISYYSGDSSTYVFTVTKDDYYFSKLDSTAIIDDKVIAFREQLEERNSTIEGFINYNQIATDLYNTILEKSIQQLPKNVEQLIIIPDGILSHIPFETLTSKIVKVASQDFSKLSYLLYDYQIQYGYSATLLRENKKRQNQLQTNSKCLAYAPPYENQTSNEKGRGDLQALHSLTQLKGTGKEIQSIATYFDGDFDQSETATKAKFIKEAPNFGILHLAMHGEANLENEKLANLKFTNTKTQEKEQYLLYQNEIANMDLNAQLVVLSACETGVGKYIYGEGIASLGRSFMYAGVPSIVMSLWKVDDKATSQLMLYFYENLAAGMLKNEALHEAKLTFLKKEDFSKLHPHYWASFVSIGDVQPIKNSTNWKYLILCIVLIFTGIAFLFFIRD